MSVKTDKDTIMQEPIRDISPHAAREYIIDMLAELCTVAKQGKQEDLLVLLKLVTQAARSTE